MRYLAVLLLCPSLVSCSPRTNPIVTITDAYGSEMTQEVFFWLSRLSEVKDRVQAKYRTPKDTMILWYVPKDRYGNEQDPIYNIDETQTFVEFETKFGSDKRGRFYLTLHR